MKKLLIIFGITCLISCKQSVPAPAPAPAPYNDALTQFIVLDIKAKEGMVNMTSYYVEVVDVNGLSCNNRCENLKFWFCDSVGKYRLGQPIHFDKN